MTLCIYKPLSGCTFNLWDTFNHILNHSIDCIIISDWLNISVLFLSSISVIGISAKFHIGATLAIIPTCNLSNKNTFSVNPPCEHFLAFLVTETVSFPHLILLLKTLASFLETRIMFTPHHKHESLLRGHSILQPKHL